jgi:uncharacterized protein YjiS (DUF1127 family)
VSHALIDVPESHVGWPEGMAAAGPCTSTGFRGRIRRAFDTLAVWRRRAIERRDLAAMGERMRKDIGLSSVDVWREINKPVWRA